MITNYLLDIVILLAAAVITVPAFRSLGLGAVPGFLVAGVLVGPSGLSLIDNVNEIGQLAELGVVLLLFVIGVELKPARLWLMRRQVFGLGSLQLVATGAVIAVGAHLLLDVPVAAAVVIGPALALSSTAFCLQLLSEQRLLNSEYGRASLAVLLLQDLAVVPLLALVPLVTLAEFRLSTDIALALIETAVILVLVIAGGRYLLQPILQRVARTRTREVFTAMTGLLVLGTALLTEHVGLSMAMGAFIAGLLIADSPFRHDVIAEIEPFRGLLLGLFFLSMGMFLDIGVFLASPLLTVGLLALLVVTKFGVLYLITRWIGPAGRSGVAVALLLAQSGEFGLVLLAYANQVELIGSTVFQQLLVVVILSMLVTAPLASAAERLARPRGARADAKPDVTETAPIVLAGYGRVGRRIGRMLKVAGMPYVAIEQDSSLVLEEREQGHPVFVGDARRPDVLRSAGVADASTLIVTVDDFEAAERIVAAAHQAYPNVRILARAHNAEQCGTLLRLGASAAVSENLEASLELARKALAHQSINAERVEALIRQYRLDYYAQASAEKLDREQ